MNRLFWLVTSSYIKTGGSRTLSVTKFETDTKIGDGESLNLTPKRFEIKRDNDETTYVGSAHFSVFPTRQLTLSGAAFDSNLAPNNLAPQLQIGRDSRHLQIFQLISRFLVGRYRMGNVASTRLPTNNLFNYKNAIRGSP